jgi:hypothetical protein
MSAYYALRPCATASCDNLAEQRLEILSLNWYSVFFRGTSVWRSTKQPTKFGEHAMGKGDNRDRNDKKKMKPKKDSKKAATQASVKK